jgi:phosphomannomutase
VGNPAAGHRFDASLLRQYDVRGVWGQTLHGHDAWALGRCFASVVHRAGGSCVAVGRDGRLSSPVLEAALVEGLVEGGMTVRRLGLVPTPVLYYAVVSAPDVHGGVEVTGSHNPRDHNGFKLDLGGRPFFGDDLAALGPMAAAGAWDQPTHPGRVEPVDLIDAYVARILQALDGVDPTRIDAMTIGWDAGNGAAGPVIERLVRHLPGRHVLFHTAVDGNFPHHHPDPTEIANLTDLIEAVAAGRIDMGFAFDGDGDRLGVVDGRGRVLWGDQITQILARDLLQRRPGARIMADVKCSQALFDAISAGGGVALMAPTGHSLIKSAMQPAGALLAGEMTGHVFCADDYYGYDDAFYAALRLLAASDRLGQSITAVRDVMPAMHATPDLRIPAADPPGALRSIIQALIDQGVAHDATDGARITTPDGWYLLRASNTEAMLTARAESPSAAGLGRLLAEVDDRLARVGIRRRR